MATYYCPSNLLDRPIRVLLLGAGGTGGEVLDGLCRLHHGLIGTGHPHGLHVTVMDGDTVSPSNIGRQRFSPADVGQPKATLLVHRINMFYGLNWEAVPFYFDAEEPDYHRCDLLMTCVDKATVRVAIGSRESASWDTPALWMDFGNGERTGQVVLGHLQHGAEAGLRLPNVFDLYPELSDVDDNDAPSCSLEAAIRSQDLFINRQVADVGLSLLWDLLRKGQLERHGGFVDLAQGTVTPLLINSESWRMFGYAAPSSVPDSATT
jgi:PRTRC genetic system ThiF family protein